MIASLKRVLALIIKELHQVARDPSSIGIAVVLPAMMLILYGYGVSMDIRNIRVAFHSPASSERVEALAGKMMLSPYFDFIRVNSIQEAENLFYLQKVDTIIDIPSDFDSRLEKGSAQISLVVHGVNANQARLIGGYVEGIFSSWLFSAGMVSPAQVQVKSIMRFNEKVDSSYYIIPGGIVIIMTMIGGLLTALVMAREYERGTLESLFATPVTSGEILAAKSATNFMLGIVSFCIALFFSFFIFKIPLRGSFLILLGVSSLYLIVALGLGLVISTVTKKQFLASQLAILLTFLPAMMLSGFLFDTLSMPPFLRAITWIFPARYYVTLMQSLFLAGDIPSLILPSSGALLLFAVVLMTVARLKTPKSLD